MAFARIRPRDGGLDEMLIAIASLALLLALCFITIRHLLKPIERLQTTVQRISAGELDARTGVSGKDDLAQLAQSVDQMSAQIEQMLDAKRELLRSA